MSMKIAISADCFSAFTSGFPVRGMTLALIKGNPDVRFVLLYTRRAVPASLSRFYEEINSLPNVEVRYFKGGRRSIALKRMFNLKYVELEADCDCYLDPGRVGYLRGFKGPQIGSLADLSTLKGLSTNKYALFYKYWNRCTFKYFLPKITKIVTISEYTRNDLLGYYPALKDQTLCIYNGIDTFWFDNRTDKVVYKKLVGEENASYFIWWGLISRRKNIVRLTAAYRRAKARRPDLPKLLLVGSVAEYMEEITKEFGGDIIHIPFQENYTLKSLVRNSRGLLFPSLYEGFGLPVIEAFSQGVNVACSNVTSLPEVADGKAILFDPQDDASIEQAIIDLSDKEADGQELVVYASNFSYARAAEQYMDLIKELVK